MVLWGGGVYNWLDPVSVLRAADRLRRRLPELRLVFLGMQHPNPDVPRMRVATRLQELAAELGLTGKYVFFNAGWVPYARRADFLLDADVAVSTHLDHLETRYAFRSRVLDYLWAGLPMVLTGGDVLAEEIARARLGVTVPAGEDEMLEEALAQMLASPPPHQLFAAVARRHTWERAAKPILEFCSAPRRARTSRCSASRPMRQPTRATVRGASAVPVLPWSPWKARSRSVWPRAPRLEFRNPHSVLFQTRELTLTSHLAQSRCVFSNSLRSRDFLLLQRNELARSQHEVSDCEGSVKEGAYRKMWPNETCAPACPPRTPSGHAHAWSYCAG